MAACATTPVQSAVKKFVAASSVKVPGQGVATHVSLIELALLSVWAKPAAQTARLFPVAVLCVRVDVGWTCECKSRNCDALKTFTQQKTSSQKMQMQSSQLKHQRVF